MSMVIVPALVVGALVALFGSVIAGLYLATRLTKRSGRGSSGIVAISVVLALVAVPLLAMAGGLAFSLSSGVPSRVTEVRTAVPVVSVPDLTGLDEAQARQLLLDLGLAVAVRSRPDATLAAGSVVGQEPVPGSQVMVGQTLTLTVAAAPGSGNSSPRP
jgi:hypothetical protein